MTVRVVLLALLALALAAPGAQAQTRSECAGTAFAWGGWDLCGKQEGTDPGGQGQDAEPTEAWEPPPDWKFALHVYADENGGPCTRQNWAPPEQQVWRIPMAIYPDCPADEGAAAAEPVDFAISHWSSFVPPEPHPTIPPGKMIVGLPAYLVTDTAMTYTPPPVPSPFGDIIVSATSEFEVDWGDGTPPKTYDHEGLRYPRGRITHVYQWAGTYDITVTQRWRGEWRWGGQSGPLGVREQTATIADFEVGEVQAVVGD